MSSAKLEEFRPYIPASKVLPEMTGTAIVVGIVMSVVFGAANAFLGLRIGMTVSASIPAAVISMGVLRVALKRGSIMENNMVQTIASAGESLAAGVIFTLPALFIWAKELGIKEPTLFTITMVSLFGGLLGVMFMVPLRKALIVKEHGVLPYPEGLACFEILQAGDKKGSGASYVFGGLGIGAIQVLLSNVVRLFPKEAVWHAPNYKGGTFALESSPALAGVGYILRLRTSLFLVAGTFLGWGVLIPLIAYLGQFATIPIPPAEVPISELDSHGIWNSYIRYIGAGAVAYGGVVGLIRALPMVFKGFHFAGGKKGFLGDSSERTNQSFSTQLVIIVVAALILILAFTPFVPVGLVGALAIAIFGFLFTTVSSRIVGIVGSSSNPVSGMTIATLMITASVVKAIGIDGTQGMVVSILVGAVVCIAAAIGGDTSQDLKTGFLVGATPRKQQIGEVIGVAAAALTVGSVLIMLDRSYGFGTKELPAPQATLMKLVVEGVMNGDLPWAFITMGVIIGVCVHFLHIPILPVAIGLYLPISLNTTIGAGALVRALLDWQQKKAKGEEAKARCGKKIQNGILVASGFVAVEGILGIFFALLAWQGIRFQQPILTGRLGTLGALLALLVALYFFVDRGDKKQAASSQS